MSSLHQTKKRLNTAGKIGLICMFLIIIAGSFVRITGSGMGCPDWPKCFGYYIPPTEISTVSLEEGRSYEKGQMVIYHDTLWIAEQNFNYSSEFWKTNFGSEAALKVYPKHQYAEFNAFHTWTEYINRLLTGLLGLPILVMTFLALIYYKKSNDYWPVLYSVFAIVMILFEAWLGKMVVDKNLNTSTITLHMVGSLGILLSLLFLIRRTNETENYTIPPTLRKALSFFFLIHLVQLLLGTQVRESVDLLLENGVGRNFIVDNLPVGFKIHRSFSILIVILTTMMFLQYKRLQIKPRKFLLLFGVIGFEILFGVGLAYLGLPIVLQPLHLLFSIILFALSGMILLETKKK
ncbi:MAG: COX15/CtaA family protein [Flavobacteriales bacterium]|nr:COX15/CtaA family protein [Flavobacteriales bacterium]